MRRTFVSSNGELAWFKSDLPEAIAALITQRFSVIGFEAWLASPGGRWTGLLPEVGTSTLAVVAGDVADRKDGEAIERYTERVTASVTADLDRIAIETTIVPEALGLLRYHLVIESRFPPNQSTDPTLASGTSPAGQEPRPR